MVRWGKEGVRSRPSLIPVCMYATKNAAEVWIANIFGGARRDRSDYPGTRLILPCFARSVATCQSPVSVIVILL